jgi:hypothetical protein
MKHLTIFEEFKIKKTKKIHKHLDKERGGVEKIVGNITDKSSSYPIDILGDVLKSVTKRFGLKSKVKYMNSGSFGMAFVVGDDKIVKLTSSKSEAMVAKFLVGKKIDHCVNYYDIVYIKEYSIYAILMDRAEKLSEKEKYVVSLLSGSAIYMNDLHRLEKKVRKDDFEIMGNNKNHKPISESKLKRVYDDFREMYISLKKNKISITDLHENNIGYVNNKMVHFDIMGDTKKKDITKISKLKIKS